MRINERITITESSRPDEDACLGKLFPEVRSGGADWGVRAWRVKGTGPNASGTHDGHFITNDDNGEYSLVRRRSAEDPAKEDEERWDELKTGDRKTVVDAALDLAGRSSEKTDGPVAIQLHSHRAADFLHGHREAERDHKAHSTPDYHSAATIGAIHAELPYHINPGQWSAEHVKTVYTPHDLHGAGTVHVKVTPTRGVEESTLYAAYAYARAQYSKALDAPVHLLGRTKKAALVARRQEELSKAKKALGARGA